MKSKRWMSRCLLLAALLFAPFEGVLDLRAQTSAVTVSKSSAAVPPLDYDAIKRRWDNASIPDLKAAAQSGDATAQYYHGSLLLDGERVREDLKEGMEWVRKSADQGLAQGQAVLGICYERAVGVPRNRQSAMDWMIKAAEQGLTGAEFELAEMYAMEEPNAAGHIKGNYPVAAEWYEKAARKAHVKSEFALATLYHTGKLGNAQRSNSVPWFLKAAQHGHDEAKTTVGDLERFYPGHPLLKGTVTLDALRDAAEKGSGDALYQLAKRYEEGNGVPKDLSEAFRWMKQAVSSQNGHPADASYELAQMYENGRGTAKNPSLAWPLYIAAAKLNVDSAFRVGRMYEEGEGVAQSDTMAAEYFAYALIYGIGTHKPEAAERLARLYAAGRGIPREKTEAKNLLNNTETQIQRLGLYRAPNTQYYLGEIYFQGRLIPQDREAAVACYTKAAELGSAKAQNRLGELWASGLNGEPNFEEAAAYYRKAANRGLAVAQFNLGMCYAKGNGVPVDNVEAWRWLNEAAAQEFQPAITEFEKVQKVLPREQLDTAKAKGSPVSTLKKL